MQYNNAISQQIFIILEELLGTQMALATMQVQAQKLGITEESMTVEHLSQFAKNTEPGLRVFLGTEKAAKVTKRIESIMEK